MSPTYEKKKNGNLPGANCRLNAWMIRYFIDFIRVFKTVTTMSMYSNSFLLCLIN